MEVMQVNDTHLWTRGSRRLLTGTSRGPWTGTCVTTRRNAAGMKIFVKRTGTENFSRPTSSNLETRERWRQ